MSAVRLSSTSSLSSSSRIGASLSAACGGFFTW